MFLRLKKTDSGQVLKLLESYRDPDGIPRHRTIVSLGNPAISKDDYSIIARMVENHFKSTTLDMFDSVDATDEILGWVDRIIHQIENEKKWTPDGKSESFSSGTLVKVNTGTVSHEHTSELGPVLVGVHAWNELGFDQILRSCEMPESRIHSACVAVVNRLVDPVAENSLLDWYRSTALPDILQEKLSGAGDDRFYRASDSLLKHQETIETAIRKKTAQLHHPDRTILLYDLTNTHFEGACADNPKAKYGKNKQGRSDCPQVVIGMIFDTSGFELGHHMFSGNQADSTSLPEMLKTMTQIASDSNTADSRVLVVMDAGMSSAANLTAIRDAGYSYLVNDRRPLRKRYKDEFLDKESFTQIEGRAGKTPILVRHLITDTELDDGSIVSEQLLLCMSTERGDKEKAIISTSEKKFVDELEKLKKRIEKGSLKKQGDADTALGKLAERYSRVYRYYTVVADVAKKTLSYTTKEIERTEAEELCGGYVLRTNDTALDKDTIWQTYIALTTAENGFRTLKGNLGLRPNFHQKEKRVDGHVFITVLAYQLLRHIMAKLEHEGDNRSWETIRRILKTHAYTTMIIPEIEGDIHRIRKAGNPDETHKAIYNVLGVNWNKLPTWHVRITPQKNENL
jgi:transposase